MFVPESNKAKKKDKKVLAYMAETGRAATHEEEQTH